MRESTETLLENALIQRMALQLLLDRVTPMPPYCYGVIDDRREKLESRIHKLSVELVTEKQPPITVPDAA